jgi:hypothetical protein
MTIVTAFLPLLGVLLGAALQHFFSRSAELSRHERLLRVEAYSDYLKSVGEAEALRSDPTVLARAIAAKARVCVHGSAEVIEALAHFEAHTSPTLTPEKRQHFLNFVEAVRRDVSAKGKLSKQTVEQILF